ncbi:hypothetical protein B0H67DRAFT_606564 [Lasiosphaeris hirsuta]|uniref:Geranylgeranyl pyrophosphate synthetase n=1 Tax=Lasiosphaeris hirsuta TaxID=260670 RepID=A0AA40BD57_9PEZI|nr:hypothetical protein B0H67DRAFT_606564 [Lasiosphaeris hirsuta]
MESEQAITEISRSGLTDRLRSTSKITELRHLASYSWLDRPKPTISVPGSPPCWSPPSGPPPKLQPDSGTVYIDQNAANSPRFPLEPLFRALYVEKPDFDMRNIDLVTDRNNMRKLLRFVQASSKDAFQIRVEIAGDNTALFTRVEAKATDFIQGFRGYGRNFEKAYTKRERGSSSHHRIVAYSFGGLQCIVRHETDGYVGRGPVASVDSLSGALGGLSLSRSEAPVSSTAGTAVEAGGRAVDLSSTLEIKTRAASREVDMVETFPQLWISQTPKLVVGYHRNGVFDKVQLREMTDAINQWEEGHQRDLCRLACLLADIIAAVKRSGSRRAVVSYTGGPGLLVVPSDENPALPDELYTRWESSKQQSIETAKPGVADAAKPKLDAKGKQGDAFPFLIPAGTPFSEDIKVAVQKGFRQFFRRMPTNLPDYRVLCKTLTSLPINVLAGGNVRGIMGDMRRGKDDYDAWDGSKVDGLKGLARDSAFRLLHLFLVQESWDVGDRNAAYNAALFVVSHPRIFKYRTRKMVRAAFEDRFRVSDGQRKSLDKWPVGSSSSSEEDVTTEDEDFYDSDDLDYF